MGAYEPVRFGIVGCGRISTNAMAPALRDAENAELVAAASRDRARAAACGAPEAYDDYAALLDDDAVEAVYIGTHNGLHRELTLAALARGKHVLCEKPMACTADEAREMIAAAEARDRLLAEAFMYRHHPQIHQALALIESGRIGDVRAVEASFTGQLIDTSDVRFTPAWGGGALYDVGCYCVSACRTFFRGLPIQVQASAVQHPQCGIDVRVHGILEFPDGGLGAVMCGFDAAFRNRVTVCGTEGNLVLPVPFTSSKQPTELHLTCGDETEIIAHDPVDTFRLEVEQLSRAIREGSGPLVGGQDALENAAVIDALFEAARVAKPVPVNV